MPEPRTLQATAARTNNHIDVSRIQRPMQALIKEVSKGVVGVERSLEHVAICLLTEGAHILFEDVPGVGKSVMASIFARASGTVFKRIQFTPDLLPADITGTYVMDRKTGAFEFKPGPVFSNFLLADEINRASPKTQSALLEAMAEKQVSVEGNTHRLDKPFIVMATQNPIDQEGTYPLPEAQMDRFMIKTSMGYLNHDDETEVLMRREVRKKDDFDVAPVMNADTLRGLQKATEDIQIQHSLIRYITALIVASRNHPDVLVGCSPRGSLALLKLAKAQAAMRGRPYVVPDDIKGLAQPVMAHRLILKPEPRIRGVTTASIVKDILSKVPVPKQ